MEADNSKELNLKNNKNKNQDGWLRRSDSVARRQVPQPVGSPGDMVVEINKEERISNENKSFNLEEGAGEHGERDTNGNTPFSEDGLLRVVIERDKSGVHNY